jgi:flagellar basal body-associated protein FliL
MNKKMIIILIIIGVIAISIGLYTILPLFTNTVVDEPLPTASGLSLIESSIDNSQTERLITDYFGLLSLA